MTIDTAFYTIPSSRFLSMLAIRKAKLPIAITALLTVTAIILGAIIDARFYIVALMILALVAPLIMFMLYMFYALSPRSVHNKFPHAASFTDKNIMLRIKLPVSTENEQEANEPGIKIVRIEIPYKDVKKMAIGLSALILEFRKPYGLLIIPYDKLPDSDELIKHLRRTITSG